jgi:hypothetical protein
MLVTKEADQTEVAGAGGAGAAATQTAPSPGNIRVEAHPDFKGAQEPISHLVASPNLLVAFPQGNLDVIAWLERSPFNKIVRDASNIGSHWRGDKPIMTQYGVLLPLTQDGNSFLSSLFFSAGKVARIHPTPLHPSARWTLGSTALALLNGPEGLCIIDRLNKRSTGNLPFHNQPNLLTGALSKPDLKKTYSGSATLPRELLLFTSAEGVMTVLLFSQKELRSYRIEKGEDGYSFHFLRSFKHRHELISSTGSSRIGSIHQHGDEFVWSYNSPARAGGAQEEGGNYLAQGENNCFFLFNHKDLEAPSRFEVPEMQVQKEFGLCAGSTNENYIFHTNLNDKFLIACDFTNTIWIFEKESRQFVRKLQILGEDTKFRNINLSEDLLSFSIGGSVYFFSLDQVEDGELQRHVVSDEVITDLSIDGRNFFAAVGPNVLPFEVHIDAPPLATDPMVETELLRVPVTTPPPMPANVAEAISALDLGVTSSRPPVPPENVAEASSALALSDADEDVLASEPDDETLSFGSASLVGHDDTAFDDDSAFSDDGVLVSTDDQAADSSSSAG